MASTKKISSIESTKNSWEDYFLRSMPPNFDPGGIKNIGQNSQSNGNCSSLSDDEDTWEEKLYEKQNKNKFISFFKNKTDEIVIRRKNIGAINNIKGPLTKFSRCFPQEILFTDNSSADYKDTSVKINSGYEDISVKFDSDFRNSSMKWNLETDMDICKRVDPELIKMCGQYPNNDVAELIECEFCEYKYLASELNSHQIICCDPNRTEIQEVRIISDFSQSKNEYPIWEIQMNGASGKKGTFPMNGICNNIASKLPKESINEIEWVTGFEDLKKDTNDPVICNGNPFFFPGQTSKEQIMKLFPEPIDKESQEVTWKFLNCKYKWNSQIHGLPVSKIYTNSVNDNLLPEVFENQVPKTCENPVPKVLENLIPKVLENPVPKMHENPVPKMHENPVQKIHENPVQKIHENPVQKIHENPILHENPVQKIYENPVPKICEQMAIYKVFSNTLKVKSIEIKSTDEIIEENYTANLNYPNKTWHPKSFIADNEDINSKIIDKENFEGEQNKNDEGEQNKSDEGERNKSDEVSYPLMVNNEDCEIITNKDVITDSGEQMKKDGFIGDGAKMCDEETTTEGINVQELNEKIVGDCIDSGDCIVRETDTEVISCEAAIVKHSDEITISNVNENQISSEDEDGSDEYDTSDSIVSNDTDSVFETDDEEIDNIVRKKDELSAVVEEKKDVYTDKEKEKTVQTAFVTKVQTKEEKSSDSDDTTPTETDEEFDPDECNYELSSVIQNALNENKIIFTTLPTSNTEDQINKNTVQSTKNSLFTDVESDNDLECDSGSLLSKNGETDSLSSKTKFSDIAESDTESSFSENEEMCTNYSTSGFRKHSTLVQPNLGTNVANDVYKQITSKSPLIQRLSDVLNGKTSTHQLFPGSSSVNQVSYPPSKFLGKKIVKPQASAHEVKSNRSQLERPKKGQSYAAMLASSKMRSSSSSKSNSVPYLISHVQEKNDPFSNVKAGFFKVEEALQRRIQESNDANSSNTRNQTSSSTFKFQLVPAHSADKNNQCITNKILVISNEENNSLGSGPGPPKTCSDHTNLESAHSSTSPCASVQGEKSQQKETKHLYNSQSKPSGFYKYHPDIYLKSNKPKSTEPKEGTEHPPSSNCNESPYKKFKPG